MVLDGLGWRGRHRVEEDWGYWYAFDSSCAMRTGWFKDGSTWYYLRTAANTPASGPEGAMLAGGTWTIGGKAYRFDSSGACLNP